MGDPSFGRVEVLGVSLVVLPVSASTDVEVWVRYKAVFAALSGAVARSVCLHDHIGRPGRSGCKIFW